MIKNEKELVKKLKCEELCVISSKREINPKLIDKKVKAMAEEEMNKKLCPPC